MGVGVASRGVGSLDIRAAAAAAAASSAAAAAADPDDYGVHPARISMQGAGPGPTPSPRAGRQPHHPGLVSRALKAVKVGR